MALYRVVRPETPVSLRMQELNINHGATVVPIGSSFHYATTSNNNGEQNPDGTQQRQKSQGDLRIRAPERLMLRGPFRGRGNSFPNGRHDHQSA